ncbi:hypothetical protein HK405_012725 [Cladochytrium tenue]|nr:hypothetical protein HK405_012725 [Cladochytrium tenue]
MATESHLDHLPPELLARALCRLHPHAVARLRRLSRCRRHRSAGLPIDLARWRHDELDNIAASTRAVDFRHLPVSFTIALFMWEGFSLDTINCVAEDHEWDKSSGHLDAALPGNQRVTTAFRHLIFERPDRLRSLGRKSGTCLLWAATVGDVELTREMVQRVYLEFQNTQLLTPSLQNALLGALRSGQQDIIDLLLARDDVRPGHLSLLLAATLPNVDIMRAILARIASSGRPLRRAMPSALEGAAYHGNEAVFEVLLAAADTPELHISLSNVRNIATCQRLIAAGADPSWNNARVLLDALQRKRLDLVEFLVSDPRVQGILANNETLRRGILQDAVQQGADFLELFLVGKIVTLEDAGILLRGWPSWSPPEDVASRLRAYVAEA